MLDLVYICVVFYQIIAMSNKINILQCFQKTDDLMVKFTHTTLNQVVKLGS